MNIFILDLDPVKCAMYHADKHVVKMILESAQMLCTSHRVLDPFKDVDNSLLYKKTHMNHPCSVWVRNTKGNYDWTYSLFRALSKEYEYRYGKQHLSWQKLNVLLLDAPDGIDPNPNMTPFALAMPDHYKVPNDHVQSYRHYYTFEKSSLFQWKNRPVPDWLSLNTPATTTI